MGFIEMLGLSPKLMITAVGAGGKTTLLHTLAEELSENGYSVIITTTTKIFPPKDMSKLLLYNQINNGQLIESQFKIHKVNYIGKEINYEGKLVGLAPEIVDKFKNYSSFVLIEGDGAARKSFKAPGENEPVIPSKTDIIFPVVGVSIIGKKLTEQNVHRPLSVAAVTGLKIGDFIDTIAIAKVLAKPEGYYRIDSRYIPVINQADTPMLVGVGEDIAHKIFELNPNINKVIISSLENKKMKLVRR